jgi:hypothetical protein
MVGSALIRGALWMVLSVAFIIPARPVQQHASLVLDANRCGTNEPGAVHFTLAFTGDMFLHENIQAVGESEGYDVLFDQVRPFLQAADLAYTNFDGAMLAGSPLSGYPNFNYSPALAPALRNAGIDLVSTANNHILDWGSAGVDATLALLAENAIQQHGAVPSTASERPPFLPLTLAHDDVELSVGFISATWGTNGIADPFNQVNLLYTTSDYGSQGEVRPEILAAIELAARNTDLVIVAAHWGFEYEFEPHPSQVQAARQMAAAGADIIVGAQPHTLQPITMIDTDGRTTLVAYSLGNLIASQGAFQATAFSATSAVVYVGVVRMPDGAARVTGYRYLPTIHVANDTRPAPLLPGMDATALTHVRTMMGDPSGLHQMPPEPPPDGVRVDVCPALTLAEAPDQAIPGDFAQFYATLGDGRSPRPLTDAIAVFGLPLGPVVDAPSGDCSTTTRVLSTERQRLEWYPDAAWPYRVTGSLVGVAALQRNHPDLPVERRLDLADPSAFADPRFRSVFERYGGLHVFGYPISGALLERDRLSNAMMTVQYFERARFELDPRPVASSDLLGQVRLGLLGREVGADFCGAELSPDAPASPAPNPTAGTIPPPLTNPAASPRGVADYLADVGSNLSWYILLLIFLALLITLLTLIGFAIADWQSYYRRSAQKRYRHRRSAFERFASDVPQRGELDTVDARKTTSKHAQEGYPDETYPSPYPMPSAQPEPFSDLVDPAPTWLFDAGDDPSSLPPQPQTTSETEDELLRRLLDTFDDEQQ